LDLLDVLACADEPVSAAALGAPLDLSARMVRTSLASTEDWLRAHGVRLRHIPGRGYCLEGPPASQPRLAAALKSAARPASWLTATRRVQVLLLTLFFTPGSPQIKELQQALRLSRSSTIKVLASAGDWLAAHDLRLVGRQHVGCLLEGEEGAWRMAVVQLLRESCGDARLLAILRGTATVVAVPAAGRSAVEELLAKAWRLLQIPLVRAAILPLRSDLNPALSDQAFTDLFLHAAIMVYRLGLGRTIEGRPYAGSAASAEAASRIARQLQQRCGITIPPEEVVWMEKWLPAQAAVESETQGMTSTPVQEETRELISRLIMQASLALHPGLRTDPDLVEHLTAHVRSMQERPRPAPTAAHPLLREVKSRYPTAYEAARRSSLLLRQPLGRDISEGEITDVAVCFIAAMERLLRVERPERKVLVVCSEGAVTAWLLVSRLRAEFPEVEVVKVISALEFENNRRAEGVDFIVSTIPLKPSSVPTVQVAPLLGPEDCRRLRELFERTGTAAAGIAAEVHLSHLVTSSTIELGVAASTWQEVVEQAGRGLLQAGLIDTRFIEAMKDVMIEHGPYMVIWPGAALLHASPRGVRQLCMGLVNLREPVAFGHPDNDPVRTAIVLGAIDNRTHFTALQELNRMMQDEEARAAIARTAHKSVVLNWVRRYSGIV
jgi:transcriptional antiterminator/mannitol/fructose-specific phosphotransferase system IIA component (Ntr-type)